MKSFLSKNESEREEQQNLFEMGLMRRAVLLSLIQNRKGFKTHYEQYEYRAKKVGIECKDFDQLKDKDINEVNKYMEDMLPIIWKNQFWYFFQLGQSVMSLFFINDIVSSDVSSDVKDTLKNSYKHEERSVKNFFREYATIEESDEFFELIRKRIDGKYAIDEKLFLIKKFFFDFPQKETIVLRRSTVDKSRTISDVSWVLSLARKVDGKHSEHAFLILEGQKDNRALVWFIDFVGSPVLPGIKHGKVRIVPYEGDLSDKKLIFRCDREMMDIRKADRISSTSWNISNEAANALIDAAYKAKKKPPKFNILGNKSIFAASTGVSSSAETGHNCFTWAKKQIHNLNDRNIKILEDDIMSYIFSRTSYLLVDPLPQQTFWYQKPIVVIPTTIAVTTIGVATAMVNSEQISETVSSICKIQ